MEKQKYLEYGISEDIIDLSVEAENECKKVFEEIDSVCEYNSLKVLQAFQNNCISDMHFGSTTGYGYGDIGRDTTEKVFSEVLKAEDSLVRGQFISGTHALTVTLFAAAKTWMIIPLGIAAFVVFYFVFYFAITKFDLKTPGREDEDAEEAEKKVVLANNNYTEVAAGVLKAIGGKENVSSVDYCATRLRFTIKDYTAVDEKAVKAAGAAGVIRPDKTTCQVIIGTKVQFVYDELKKML